MTVGRRLRSSVLLNDAWHGGGIVDPVAELLLVLSENVPATLAGCVTGGAGQSAMASVRAMGRGGVPVRGKLLYFPSQPHGIGRQGRQFPDEGGHFGGIRELFSQVLLLGRSRTRWA